MRHTAFYALQLLVWLLQAFAYLLGMVCMTACLSLASYVCLNLLLTSTQLHLSGYLLLIAILAVMIKLLVELIQEGAAFTERAALKLLLPQSPLNRV